MTKQLIDEKLKLVTKLEEALNKYENDLGTADHLSGEDYVSMNIFIDVLQSTFDKINEELEQE